MPQAATNLNEWRICPLPQGGPLLSKLEHPGYSESRQRWIAFFGQSVRPWSAYFPELPPIANMAARFMSTRPRLLPGAKLRFGDRRSIESRKAMPAGVTGGAV